MNDQNQSYITYKNIVHVVVRLLGLYYVLTSLFNLFFIIVEILDNDFEYFYLAQTDDIAGEIINLVLGTILFFGSQKVTHMITRDEIEVKFLSTELHKIIVIFLRLLLVIACLSSIIMIFTFGLVFVMLFHSDLSGPSMRSLLYPLITFIISYLLLKKVEKISSRLIKNI